MLALSLLSLASLALASPLAKYTKALEGRVDVTAQTLSDFQHYVQHSAAAYCNPKPAAGSRLTCSDGVCPDVQGNAVTVVTPLSGLITGITGYVATDHARKEIVLSIRGSNNVRNWISNIAFAWDTCPFVKDCKVHKGFQAAWKEISRAAEAAITTAQAANPGYRIVATGHSLGGSVATLGAVYLRANGLKVDLYHYGSPRVGNDKFADYVSKSGATEYRVTHTDDPVPRLPPIIFGYRHTTPEYWLSTTASSNDYSVSDIRVCEGTANIKCNGGTFGLNIPSHVNYFVELSNCEPIMMRAASDEISDEELEQRLNAWSQEDQDFVNAM